MSGKASNTMTVEELRQALRDLPGETPICIAYPDLQNEGAQYETLDVRLGGVLADVAGPSTLSFVLEAW